YRRAPRPGLETLVFEALSRRGVSHYQDLADVISEQRREFTDPVSVLSTLRSGRDLFLDLGRGRFRAIGRFLDFEAPTDNAWYRLPAYREMAKDELVREAQRYGSWLFVRQLPAKATLADALAELD